MKENNQINENQHAETKETGNLLPNKKTLSKPIIISIIAATLAAIVILLVLLLGGDKPNYNNNQNDDQSSETNGDQSSETNGDNDGDARDTRTLTALECYNELNQYYNNIITGKNLCFWEKIEGDEYTIAGETKITVYYDGENYYTHEYYSKDDLGWSITEHWCGKVGNEYVFVTQEDYEGKKTKNYEVVSEEYLLETVVECIEHIYDDGGVAYIEITLDCLLSVTAGEFECIKTTEGNKQYYLMKIHDFMGIEGEPTVLEYYTEDGYIVKFVIKNAEWGDFVCNYPRNQKVTMPDLSGYEEK